jgi:hypothetical protein
MALLSISLIFLRCVHTHLSTSVPFSVVYRPAQAITIDTEYLYTLQHYSVIHCTQND